MNARRRPGEPDGAQITGVGINSNSTENPSCLLDCHCDPCTLHRADETIAVWLTGCAFGACHVNRRPRTIAVVRIDDPEAFVDSVAAAVGGRERALALLEAAVRVLRGVQ